MSETKGEDAMTTYALANEHDLLQVLRTICHLPVHLPDPVDVVSQLEDILQPLLPHDCIDMVWCDIPNSRIHVGETAASCNTIEHWPMSEVMQQSEPLLIDDYANEVHREPEFVDTEVRSALLIPLRYERHLLGVLKLGSKRPQAFSAEQRELAMVLADYIAPVLQNAYLLSSERQQRERLEALDRIGYAIAASLNIDEVFETFAAQAAQLVRHEAISVTLLSEDGLSLERFAVAAATPLTPQAGERQALDETMAGFVVRSGQTLWSNDITLDERFRGSNDLQWIAAGFRSFISVPLRAKSRIIGSLNVLSRTPGFYTEADVATVVQVANAVAIFLDNMYLHSRICQLVIAEERSRIARDIHDTLMQSLTTIILQLDAIEHSDQDHEHLCIDLRRTRQVAQRALAEARHRVWDLHPRTLTEQPLPQVLGDELVIWQQSSGVPARLFVRGEGKLSLAVEVAILRIMQEALHNVHKYAKAHEARVDLEYNVHDVRLLVTDDGIGFNPQQPPNSATLTSSGFGMIAMRERAHAAGGHFHVSSWPNNGTRVEASFPLDTHKKTVQAPDTDSQTPLTARVLIVDDHTLIRQGLVELVSHIEGLLVVGTAKDGYDAMDMARQLSPDLILMDMRLPGIDGAATTRQLLLERPELHVIMLTSSDASDDLARAIEAGARGYILKEASIEQLTETIQSVLRGEAVVERRITHHLFERFNHLLRDRHQSDVLSVRELEVLRLMVEGYRNKDIAEVLVVSEHTVKSHISSIFQKLGVKDRAGAISVALQRNLPGIASSSHASLTIRDI
jgi:DNA-binding NarL/FixJ family response regulator/signal transduction histidine kinase